MSIDEIIIKNCDFHLHLLSNFIILTFVLESGAQNRKSSSFHLVHPFQVAQHLWPIYIYIQYTILF